MQVFICLTAYFVFCQSHKDSLRSTILDVRDNVDTEYLAENTQVVAEALARHVFNLSQGEVFSDSLVSSWSVIVRVLVMITV